MVTVYALFICMTTYQGNIPNTICGQPQGGMHATLEECEDLRSRWPAPKFQNWSLECRSATFPVWN
jgi:hypothetical protein